MKTRMMRGEQSQSAIAEHLPEKMQATYDGDAVVDTMQVLGRYDPVVLETRGSPVRHWSAESP